MSTFEPRHSDTEVVSVEDEQDARRKRAIAVDPRAWHKMCARERVQSYSDGAFLPFSSELLESLFGSAADPEYVVDFRKRYPFHFRMARALWIELSHLGQGR